MQQDWDTYERDRRARASWLAPFQSFKPAAPRRVELRPNPYRSPDCCRFEVFEVLGTSNRPHKVVAKFMDRADAEQFVCQVNAGVHFTVEET